MDQIQLTYLYNKIYNNYDHIINKINKSEQSILTTKFKNFDHDDEKDIICKQLLFSYILSYNIYNI